MFKAWIKKHKFLIIGIGIFTLIVGAIIGFATWVILADKNINEEQTGDGYVPTGQYAILDLGSTSCNPCIKLQPILSELREDYGETIDVVFFNITSTQDGAAMANHYNVSIMPTLLFVDKYGREIKRVVGFHTKEQIEEIFKELRWIE